MTESSVYLSAVEQELKLRTQPLDPQYADFYNIFQYHLGWQDAQGKPAQADTGKRIRPLLCLWSCEAVGGDWHDALSAAAAIELIHNFSLIHDDIQDDSPARRGRATVWKEWGIAHGINAGDAMFVLAQQAIDDLPSTLTLERYIEVHHALNRAILRLTQGQYLDLAYERADQVGLEQYFEMVRGKTAALLSASTEIGARLGTTDNALIQALADYGEQLGIAFQIADDVLGLWGDPEVTGKSARTDLLSRKKSYPVMYALQEPSHGKALRELYAKSEWSPQDVERIENLLDQAEARRVAIARAEEFASKASDALKRTGLQNEAMSRLAQLIAQVVHREK